jgi:hypothetical protein
MSEDHRVITLLMREAIGDRVVMTGAHCRRKATP